MSDLVTFGEAFPLVRSWQADWPMEIELITAKHLEDSRLVSGIASAIRDDEELADRNLCEIFFSIPSTGSVSDFDFQAGVQNQLLRFGCRNAEELGNLSIRRFRSMRNSGEGKTLAFVATLVKKHLEALSIQSVDYFPTSEQVDQKAIVAEDEMPSKKILRTLTPALPEITRIALYLHFSGDGETPLLQLGDHKTLRLRMEMGETLKKISANDLLNVEAVSTPIELVESFIESLSEPEKLILSKRLVQVPANSLQELGDELGVTRERVRQLESKLKTKYGSHLKESDELQAFVWAIREKATHLMTEKDFLKQQPTLKVKTSLRFDLLDFFIGVGDLERDGDWVQDDIVYAIKTTNDLCDQLLDNGVIECRQLLVAFESHWKNLNLTTLDAWMSHRGFHKVRNFYMDRKTISNLIFVALSEYGKPMSGPQAMAYVGEDYTRSVEYALTVSPLFTKVTKNEWDLSSRGGKQVRTIQEAIGDLLDEHGSMPLDQVINILVEQYKFAPSSVRSYATSSPFMLVNGKVKRTNAVRLPKKTQDVTRNLYKDGEALSLRVIIDSEDLRGSGSNCPAALAAFLGVAFGQSRTLQWEFGDFKVGTSGSMFNLPSIKKAADALGLGVGDQLLLTFIAGQVRYRAINLSLEGQDLIRNMTGMPEQGNFLNGLADALGIAGSPSLERIRELLVKRKEEDLLELVNLAN